MIPCDLVTENENLKSSKEVASSNNGYNPLKMFYEISCFSLFVVYVMVTIAFALYKDIWKKKEK